MVPRTRNKMVCSNGFPVFYLWGQKPILEPPYIEAHHRVCTYNETRQVTVKLPNCAPGVDPFYTYPVAVRCDCGACSTATTECETIWTWRGRQNTADGLELHGRTLTDSTSSSTPGFEDCLLLASPVEETTCLRQVQLRHKAQRQPTHAKNAKQYLCFHCNNFSSHTCKSFCLYLESQNIICIYHNPPPIWVYNMPMVSTQWE